MFSQLWCFGPQLWWYDCNFFLLFQRAPPTTGCELFLAHSTAPSPAGPRWRSTPGRAEHTCASSTADLATCVRWNQWLTLAWVSSMHITRLTLDKGRGCRTGVTVRFRWKTDDFVLLLLIAQYDCFILFSWSNLLMICSKPLSFLELSIILFLFTHSSWVAQAMRRT